MPIIAAAKCCRPGYKPMVIFRPRNAADNKKDSVFFPESRLYPNKEAAEHVAQKWIGANRRPPQQQSLSIRQNKRREK